MPRFARMWMMPPVPKLVTWRFVRLADKERNFPVERRSGDAVPRWRQRHVKKWLNGSTINQRNRRGPMSRVSAVPFAQVPPDLQNIMREYDKELGGSEFVRVFAH